MTTHACPPAGSGLMPCCGRTPLEALGLDRMTVDPTAVTCNAAPRPEHEHRWTTWRRVAVYFDRLGDEVSRGVAEVTDPPAMPGYTRQCACGDMEVSGGAAMIPTARAGSPGTAGDGFRVDTHRPRPGRHRLRRALDGEQ